MLIDLILGVTLIFTLADGGIANPLSRDWLDGE
jgi:hypothetical protein